MKTRTIVFIILGMFVSNSIFAQVPQAFKYQAVIHDTTGQVFQNQLISLRIAILKGDAQGEEVYSEIHDVWTDEFGLVNLNIGEGLEVSKDFSEIPWGDDTYFLQVKMDMDGGMNYHLLGTSQLKAVPYALYAGSSGTDSWKQSDDDIYYNDGKVGIGTSEPKGLLDIEHPGQSGGGINQEVLIEAKITDAPDDFFKLYNGTGNDAQFIPSIWGHHQSNNKMAFGLAGTISPEMDYGSQPVTVFASRIYHDEWGFEEIQNRPLFSWRGLYDEKMTMLANGFLGLGTTAPLSPLHIKGTSDLLEGREMLLVQNNSNDEFSHATIKLMSGNGITSTKLQHTAASYELEGRSELGMLGNDGQGLVLQAVNEVGEIRFETGGAGLEKERMRITKDGKVGIGTTDPGQHKLRLETTADGGDERAIAHFRNNSNAVGSLCNLYISAGESGSTVLNYTSPHYIHWGGKYKSHTMLQNNGKGLVFRTGQNDEGRVAFEFKREMGSSYTYDEKVSIKYNGFMGIGTTNPITPLHIKGTSNLYEGRDILLVQNNSNDEVSIATIKIKSGDGSTSTILQHTADSYQWEGRSELGALGNDGQGLVLAATNEEGEIRFETGGAGLEKERMRITEDGKVGIGTTTPQRKLHINNAMRLEPRYSPPDNAAEGDMYMDGNDHVLKVFDGNEWKACW